MNEKIISALVGLAGAIGNNGKTEQTDSVVMNALLNCYSSTDEDTIVTAIIKDKYTISPNCETCPTPCGNTSNYDMTKFLQNHELKTIKEDLIAETVKLVIRLNKSGKTELPEEIYKAISFFGYELSLDSYIDLINSLNQMEV